MDVEQKIPEIEDLRKRLADAVAALKMLSETAALAASMAEDKPDEFAVESKP